MSLNLSRYASPGISMNANKLKKKRAASTPVLVNTPRLLGKVDLPAGLEQIGLGIGYTRPAGQGGVRESDKEKEREKEKEKEKEREREKEKEKEKNKAQERDREKENEQGKERPLDTPRRSVSLGASMVRYGTLFANLARPRGRAGNGHGPAADADALPRASEESDAMDAVMREMYGGAWDAELGVAGYGGGGAGARMAGGVPVPVLGGGSSRRQVAGRVYSVSSSLDGGDLDTDVGSTLRLVDPASLESV